MQGENNYYGQPNQQGDSPYGQPNQQYGNSYGQPEQQYGNPYSQQGQQYGNAYGQPNQQYGNPYGQPGQQYGNPYGQPNQQYGYSPYGQQSQYGIGYGMDIAPFDNNGRPIPNRFAMKLTFSIIEMLLCNIFSLACGIVGCVFTVKANTAYQQKRWEDFKSHAKTSAIALWIGLGLAILALFGYVAYHLAGEAEDAAAGTGEVYVYVDGTRIDIPTNYAGMTELGFYLSRDERESTLSGGDFTLCKMLNDDGEHVMWCWFYNTGTSTEYVKDCAIVGVNMDYYCDNYESYRTDQGLGFDSSPRDFMEAYGVPDDIYEGGYYTEYAWYLGDKNDPVWRVMEVTFEGGQLYEIDVDYKR